MSEFKLDDQAKLSTGFKTPEDYFETLSHRVTAKVLQSESRVIPFYARKTTWIIAVAAVFILLLGLPFLSNNQQKIEQLDSTELEEYVEHQALITDEDVAVLLDNESLENLVIDLKINEKELEETLSTEYDIETYLIN